MIKNKKRLLDLFYKIGSSFTFSLFIGGGIYLLLREFFSPSLQLRKVIGQIGFLSGGLLILISELKKRKGFKKGFCILSGFKTKPIIKNELKISLILITLAYIAIQLGGGLFSPLYPGLYLLLACLVSLTPRIVGMVSIGWALFLETGIWFFSGYEREFIRPFILHILFILLFGIFNLILIWAEILRIRQAGEKRLKKELEHIKKTARDFRLIEAPALELNKEDLTPSFSGDEIGDTPASWSSVAEIQDSLYYILELLKKTLKLHTLILLWLEQDKNDFKIIECVTDDNSIIDSSRIPCEGILEAVIRKKEELGISKDDLELKSRWLPYYQKSSNIFSCYAVPLIEYKEVRGVLCADRNTEHPFSAEEKEIIKKACQYILKIIENERIFIQLERSKSDQRKLYQASQMLSSALSEDRVFELSFKSARMIVDYDFAAITLFDPVKNQHQIFRADGKEKKRFEGLTFKDNSSLASMVVKTKHYLPYEGKFNPKKQVVYTKKAQLKSMESLLILPLLVRGSSIGSLTLASLKRGVFGPETRQILQTFANLVAVFVMNAKMYQKLEELARTDPLTQLYNHRVFQEELDKKLKRTERLKKKLSLILTDIDHFKNINDTYGHPVGDNVLSSVARIFSLRIREIDLCARYGGEEFAIIMEETDSNGAYTLAERLRRDISKEKYNTLTEEFSVTISLGIATYPTDAKTKKELIQKADQALYWAKRNGRNQTVVYQKINST
jgi:diguanylate cyclase (GGDEF)-like protein